MSEQFGEHERLGEEWRHPKSSAAARRQRLDFPTVGARIKEFYAHDDQVGPFCHLHVTMPTKINEPFTLHGSWFKKGTREYAIITPKQLIVPVHRKIRLSYVDVQGALRPLIMVAANAVLDSAGIDRNSYEWDIHLVTTSDYKRSIRAARFISPARRDYLLQVAQPKYFWRCILRADHLDLMEVFLDATLGSKSNPVFAVNYFQPAFGIGFRRWLSPQPYGPRLGHQLRRMLMREHSVTTREAAARLLGRRTGDSP